MNGFDAPIEKPSNTEGNTSAESPAPDTIPNGQTENPAPEALPGAKTEGDTLEAPSGEQTERTDTVETPVKQTEPETSPLSPAPPKRKKHTLRTILLVLLALCIAAALLLCFSVRARIVGIGFLQYGKPYVLGDTGPATFDCSGFTGYVFKNAAGIELKRTASEQGYDKSYQKLETPEELKLGDLVFFNTVSDNDRCDHVGVYLGFGRFIHASSKKMKVVVSDLTDGYYRDVFSWGRRILNNDGVTETLS